MIARLTPPALAVSSIWASRTPGSSKSCRVARRISRSRSRRRAAAGCRVARVVLMPRMVVQLRVTHACARGTSPRLEQRPHRLERVDLGDRLVVAVPQHPGEPQRHAAGVAGGALDTVEGDLHDLLGPEVHDVA